MDMDLITAVLRGVLRGVLQGVLLGVLRGGLFGLRYLDQDDAFFELSKKLLGWKFSGRPLPEANKPFKLSKNLQRLEILGKGPFASRSE